MDKLFSGELSRAFVSHDDVFSSLGGKSVSALAAASSDVTLLISAEAEIVDIAYREKSLKSWDIDGWVGQAWVDTVTVESRPKIQELIEESARASLTRSRQVNHASAKAGRDLPVGYRVMSFFGSPYKIALGTDLRAMAEMQQRLVRAQIEMEKDYRRLRDIESRYRVLFHLAVEPLIVVDSQSLKILDANEGAGKLLGKPIRKLTGTSVANAFAKSEQQSVLDTLTMLAARARADIFNARPATVDRVMEVRVTPFREFGRTNMLVCIVDSDPEAAQPRQAETGMSGIIDSLPEGFVTVDDQGKIIEANPAFLDMIRVVTLDRVEDKGLENWLGGSSVDLQVLMSNLREHGTVRRFSSIIRDELGGTENVEISASRITAADGPRFGFAIRETSRMGDGKQTSAQSVPVTQFTDLVGRVPLKDLVRDTADIIEKLCIEAALRLTDNNRASAADMLGLSRQSLYIKLKRYGISDADNGED